MEKLAIIALSFVFSAAFLYSAHAMSKQKHERWAVYYGESLPAEDFLDYQVIAFDSVNHPPLRPLMNRGKTLLGYLSIGEAEEYRHDFEKIKAMGALLEENPHWPRHYIVDVRNKEWIKYLIEVKIPEILHKNFDGLMLDTLDGPLYLWEKDKRKYKGMDEAALNLLTTIRKHYPNIKLMLNRGFQALPQAAHLIDMSLAESIMVSAGTEKKQASYFPEHVTQEFSDILKRAQTVNPKLKVYSLDYWNPDDKKTLKDIYKKQRSRGFVPYVTTIDLMRHSPEPN